MLTTATTPFRVPLVVQGASEAKEKVYHIERPVDDGLFFPGILPGESKGLVKEGMSLTFPKILSCLDQTCSLILAYGEIVSYLVH